MGILTKLFSKPDYQEMIDRGATILDVRTPGEFNMGHPKKAINIPLDQITKNLGRIKKMSQPIITCCASGMRSSKAKSILRNEGIEVVNAGSWTALTVKQ